MIHSSQVSWGLVRAVLAGLTLIVTATVVFVFVIDSNESSGPRLEAIEVTTIAIKAIGPITGKFVGGCGAKSFDEDSGLWTVDCREIVSGVSVKTVWTVDDETEAAVRIAPPDFPGP